MVALELVGLRQLLLLLVRGKDAALLLVSLAQPWRWTLALVLVVLVLGLAVRVRVRVVVAGAFLVVGLAVVWEAVVVVGNSSVVGVGHFAVAGIVADARCSCARREWKC
jgi:hypothetical protein